MNIETKRSELIALRQDLVQGATALQNGTATPEQAAELESKAQEAEQIQDELERFETVSRAAKSVDREARKPINPALPDEGGSEAKSIGEQFTDSDIYKGAEEGRLPRNVPSAPFFVRSPLAREAKAVTAGTGVVRSGRDGRPVRDVEQERLTLRNILNVRPINGSTVDYVTVGATEAGAPVAEGGLKPEADINLGTATAPVRTIAATTPISEQQLQDVQQIQDIINDELSYQVRLVEERQVLWGDGTGENLLGILNTPGVPTITRGGTHLLDRIASGQTDVRMAGFEPNAVIIHPLDWEEIVQLKDTSNGYIYANPQVDTANMRLWGMRVVVATSAQETSANTTEERNLVVGDFQRGATLYDRSTLGIQIGYVNDQFRRNQRTIRAEERVAFAVRSAAAFAVHQTVAPVV